jgi:hypothetical protein
LLFLLRQSLATQPFLAIERLRGCGRLTKPLAWGGMFMSEGKFAARLIVAAFVAASVCAGCERKERVIDVRTPAADVKVDRNIDTGEVQVKTERK